MDKSINQRHHDENDSDDELDYNQLRGLASKDDKEFMRQRKKLIVILEHANLELTPSKKRPTLITIDDHAGLIKKMNKTYEDYRPDVAHQCLLALLDSPLNKAGYLQVYMRTKQNVLIEINPKTHLPRTYKRFCGLMAQLLSKLRIRALNSSEVLLKVISNPVVTYLPFNCPIIATNEKAKLVNIDDYADSLNKGNSVAFVIGAMSKGDLDINYHHEAISVSSYALTAGVVCAKLCSAFEKCWDVL